MGKVADGCLKQIFYNARTHSKWHDIPVPDDLLQEVYNIMRFGPTSFNSSPLRIVFLKSDHAKDRLKPHLDPANIAKTMAAPVTAILAYDVKFYEYLSYLFPFSPVKSWFEGKEEFTERTAFRNSSMQGAYFIIAARACGLDCGPMSGFSNKGVDKEFFPDGRFKSNFLCNLGYGDSQGLPGPRAPRFSFDEVCKII